MPAPVLPQQQIRVAVGLSPEVLGDKQEKALLDRLEQSARASSEPATEVRRLRAGSAEARVLCREGRDDLIVTIEEGVLQGGFGSAVIEHLEDNFANPGERARVLRVGLPGLFRADFVAILPRCPGIAAAFAPHQREKSLANPSRRNFGSGS